MLKIKAFLKKAFNKLPPRLRKILLKPWVTNLVLVFLVISIVSGGIILLWASSLKTPDLQSFDSRLVGNSTKIYDRDGEILLYGVNQQVRRTVIPFDQISPYLKSATISIEDEGFYRHNGIQFSSIIRAILVNALTLNFTQGGSTITQQVIKNSLLTSEKKISRKLKEWVLAIKLERSADKDFILNLYLNQTPYGGNVYGVEEASRAFFSKSATDITLSEAAYVAAVAQAPTYYSPFGVNRDALENRKNLVLQKMLQYGYITDEQHKIAREEIVEFNPQATNSLKAPHFVMFVLNYLEKKYGKEAVYEGGLKVITTLDYDMQSKAETIVKDYVLANEKKFRAENASLVAIDPKSGQVLTMIGSRDYFDKNIQGNFNVATARRQPGSSFKPFVYVTAFNKGYSTNTVIYDVFTEFSSSCNPDGTPKFLGASCYHPPNYEGGYKGSMTMRSALAQSRNIPAVKTLYLAGLEQTLDTARAFGITNLSNNLSNYGLSLALGTAEVSPLELTAAYGAFANNGEMNPTVSVIRVEDRNGNTLEEFKENPRQVYPEEPVLVLNDILADNVARNTIFTLNFIPGRKVALKTGTTNDSRDAWILGYTPNLAVGAWMGNNNNTPMSQVSSALIIGPMWQKFMIEALKEIPVEDFKAPSPSPYQINTEVRPHSILYYVNKDNPTEGETNNPSSDALFENWETGVRNWLIQTGVIILEQNNEIVDVEEDKNKNKKEDEVVLDDILNP